MRRGFLQTAACWMTAMLGPDQLKAGEASTAQPASGLEETDTSNLDLFSFGDVELAGRAITPVDLGELVVQSGRIRACDPLAYPDYPPLKRQISPGRYPVRIYFAFGRVAAASMRLAPGIPVSWELAEVEPSDTYGATPYAGMCPVDAGMAGFMDADTYAQMERRIAKVEADTGDKNVNYYDDVVAAEVAVNDDEWTLHQPMDDSDLNVAIFHSGWGDGAYPVLWGLSTGGNALVLFTDFTVMKNADGRKEPE